jgi:hypothetical protein
VICPEIFCGIPKKIVLGFDGKYFIKDAQKVEFQFLPQKMAKYPFLAAENGHNLKKRSSVRAEIFFGMLEKIVLGFDGKNSIKDAQRVVSNLTT